jgi:hypothetical protein
MPAFRGLPPGEVCQVHHLRLYELMRAIRERQGKRTGDVCVDCAKRAHSQELKEARGA